MNSYFIGLDIGTSSVKGVLRSVNGKIEAKANEKFHYYIKDNIKLHDADEFCNICFYAIKQLVEKLPEDGKIEGLCCSGASGNLVIMENDQKVCPIYGWQNIMDSSITEPVMEQFPNEEVYLKVGWQKIDQMPLAVLAYLHQVDPEKICRAYKICMHIEYLNYKLTNQWGITTSMGTPFYLIDQEKAQYNQKMLSVLEINEKQLPPIKPTCSKLGGITSWAGEKTGLEEGTPVVLGTFDHPSAARGAGVFDTDQLMLSCGTSWVAFKPFKTRKQVEERKMMIDPFLSPNGNYAGMKSLDSVSELIDANIYKYLGNISYQEFDKLSEKSTSGANGFSVGQLADNYKPEDIARGIMEDVAKQLKHMLESMKDNSKEIRIVGGITNSKIFLQVIREITGRNIIVVNGETAGAVGSAIMAGIGTGYYSDEKNAVL